MKKEITLQNKKITYTLRKNRRSRRVRLVVNCDGTVVVTTPFGFEESIAERFIREQSRWLFSKLAFFGQFKGQALRGSRTKNYLTYKDEAHRRAVERVTYFNSIYNFSFHKISIRNQKTRWGSCSKKGNLSFTYKIALLPQQLADYVIVHELCHLGEFNHSKKFWSLVAKTIPDHASLRSKLKKSRLGFS